MNKLILELTKKLISKKSISPNDSGCQSILIKYLKKQNFYTEVMKFHDTTNLWAYHGNKGKTLVFAGHTDVVPTEDNHWISKPFSAYIKNGFIYGRGASDMKGAISAMIVAANKFVKKYPLHKGKLAFLITSDEENLAINGSVKVIQTLIKRKEKINYCVIGEPTSKNKIADTIKHGRRGSLTGVLTINGIGGHIAYPDLVKNPIHLILPCLNELIKNEWNKKTEFFPSTKIQIYSINTDNIVNNSIPKKIKIKFNFRYSPNITQKEIQKIVQKIIKKYLSDFQIKWISFASPFLNKPSKLVKIVNEVIYQNCGYFPKLSTDGGTSDGRFFNKIKGIQIVELGLLNHTIHQVNEYVQIQDLYKLSDLYFHIMKKILL
ncbi:MAG: succinyl-diaminopimelate desuccinylase [Arsenophonus sp.]|nr:MAG: succinyl-diaminopimelate desuccinylase [Arsenophonus sp.]